MSDCDHANLITPFCPQCGEPMTVTPIGSLLAHLRLRCRHYSTRVNNASLKLERIEKGTNYAETLQRYLESDSRSLAKWTSWRDALIEVMKP